MATEQQLRQSMARPAFVAPLPTGGTIDVFRQAHVCGIYVGEEAFVFERPVIELPLLEDWGIDLAARKDL